MRKSQIKAVLFDTNPFMTQSSHGPPIFFGSSQSITLNIHNANCENGAPCVFAGPSWTPVNLPCGGVNRLLDMQSLRNRGSSSWELVFVMCLKFYMYLTLVNIWRLSIVCRKTGEACANVIHVIMFNHAVNACPVHSAFYVKLWKIYVTLFLQCANFTYMLITVTE